MTNSRLNAVIKNHRTTSTRLAQIVWEYPLNIEQVTHLIWHEHTNADIISNIFTRYGKFPDVSLAVAKRVDFIDSYTLERLTNIITTNEHYWSRDEWTSVMNVFKEKMQNHHFAEHCEMLYLRYDDCTNQYQDDDETSIFDSEDAAPMSTFCKPFDKGEYDHLSYSSNVSDWE